MFFTLFFLFSCKLQQSRHFFQDCRIIFAQVRAKAVRTVFDAGFRIAKAAAALVAQGVQRTVAKQAAKGFRIGAGMAGEIFAGRILKEIIVWHRLHLLLLFRYHSKKKRPPQDAEGKIVGFWRICAGYEVCSHWISCVIIIAKGKEKCCRRKTAFLFMPDKQHCGAVLKISCLKCLTNFILYAKIATVIHKYNSKEDRNCNFRITFPFMCRLPMI